MNQIVGGAAALAGADHRLPVEEIAGDDFQAGIVGPGAVAQLGRSAGQGTHPVTRL